MKQCKFCKVDLKRKVGNICGIKGRGDKTTIDYYWCSKCGLMYKGETIEGFYLGDEG